MGRVLDTAAAETKSRCKQTTSSGQDLNACLAPYPCTAVARSRLPSGRDQPPVLQRHSYLSKSALQLRQRILVLSVETSSLFSSKCVILTLGQAVEVF